MDVRLYVTCIWKGRFCLFFLLLSGWMTVASKYDGDGDVFTQSSCLKC